MSRNRVRDSRPCFERLEGRLQLSAAIPANSIGVALGNVAAPREVTATSVTVAPKNLTQGKSATLFGIFVQPEPGSSVAPKIVGVEGSNGQRLPVQQGRPYVAGRDDGQAAAFVKVSQPGPLTILVTGQQHSTGAYEANTTLVGDVNGDGTVNQADLQGFAAAYETGPGNPNYNLAADFNHDGIVNQADAKALMENMPSADSQCAVAARDEPASRRSGSLRCSQELGRIDAEKKCHDRRAYHAGQYRTRG